MHTWSRDAQLPLPTVVVLAVLALIPWLNAIINRYRFNVALALLATVPVAIVLIRGALTARAGARVAEPESVEGRPRL